MAPKPKGIKKYTQPFVHYHIPNFLAKEQYDKLVDVYQHLQFKDKHTDLFHFFQTDELADYSKIQFFKKELDKQFHNLPPMTDGSVKPEDTFYSIFASYYFKGNYLLCHDDVIEDRKYAFSYYLQDFPTGELVLFNDQANKQVKRVKVTKNTLVIFQVSNISYHEVAYCKTDGRKAITGWFNIKGLGDSRMEKSLPSLPLTIPKGSDVMSYPLPKEYTEQEYFQLMDVEYQFNITKEEERGPYYCRKIAQIDISPKVIFELEGYSLFTANFYRVREGDYILLNDPLNKFHEKEGMIDIFVTSLPDDFVQQEDSMLIKIVQEDGEMSGIPEIHDSIFLVNRGNKQYYIERNQKQFMFAHFVYIKQEKPKKVKAEGKSSIPSGTFTPAELEAPVQKKQKSKALPLKKEKKIEKQVKPAKTNKKVVSKKTLQKKKVKSKPNKQRTSLKTKKGKK